MTTQPQQLAPSTPVVRVKTMRLSDGRSDYFVSIKVGDKEITPFVFKEEYKAAYEAASFDWLLNGADEPNILDYGPDGFQKYGRTRPITVGGSPSGRPLKWMEREVPHFWQAEAVLGSYIIKQVSTFYRFEHSPDGLRDHAASLDDAKEQVQVHHEKVLKSLALQASFADSGLLEAVKALLDNDGGPGSKQFDAHEFAKARKACQDAIAAIEK
jgi:hypothetical protein